MDRLSGFDIESLKGCGDIHITHQSEYFKRASGARKELSSEEAKLG